MSGHASVLRFTAALGVAILWGCGDDGGEPDEESDPTVDTMSPAVAIDAMVATTLVEKRTHWLCWDKGGVPTGVDWKIAGGTQSDAWKYIPLPAGYGESYLATTISYGGDPNNKHVTTYFRRDFFVEDPSQVTSLRLDAMYDDGFVVYLNGQEIGRAAMPSGSVTASTLSTGHEANNAYVSFDVSTARAILEKGVNLLAVEVHQVDRASSDLVFDAGLAAVMNTDVQPPQPTLFGIPRRSTWRYWDRGSVDPSWNALWFSDYEWHYGPGPLGYGESYLGTTVTFGPSASNKYITTYFRTEFEIPDPTVVSRMTGELMYDDGAVVYLNGTEIWRASMPSGTVTPSTLASGHEAGNAYVTLDLTAFKHLLVEPMSRIAVEVHQQAGSSSDLVFDFALTLEGGAPPPMPREGITRRSSWQYYDQGEPPADWRTREDIRWDAGNGPLGYGESYINHEVSYGPSATSKHITTSFRRDFFVGDPASIASLRGDLMYDDGAVVYLNGVEIARASMPSGPVTFNTLAFGHEAGNTYEPFDWTSGKGALVEGRNIIAVEVHQQAASSSDLVFDLALTITRSGPPAGMVWAKHPENPQTVGVSPSVVKLGEGNWAMFYAASSGDGSVWKATSSDGIHWTGHVQVLGPMSDFGVRRDPFVLFDGSGFRMWYSDRGMRYATSPDGTVWTVHPTPALSRGSYPTVLIDGGVYRMWYSAGFHPDDLVGQITFGHATSFDGVTWTDHGEVFSHGRVSERLTVVKEGTRFRGWFHSFGWNPPSDIYFATSTDGIHWDYADEPVLWASGGWEGESVGQPYVMRDGTRLRMYYVGRNYGNGTPQIGMAVNPP